MTDKSKAVKRPDGSSVDNVRRTGASLVTQEDDVVRLTRVVLSMKKQMQSMQMELDSIKRKMNDSIR